MLKKLLLSATVATATLVSAQLLADPGHGRHGQNTPCTGEKCPTVTGAEHGQHGMRQGAMHERMQTTQGGRAGKGAHGHERGNAGEGCPMHTERKAG